MAIVSIPGEGSNGALVALQPGDSESSASNTHNYLKTQALASAVLNPASDPEWPSRLDGYNEHSTARTGTTGIFWYTIEDPSPAETAACQAILTAMAPP